MRCFSVIIVVAFTVLAQPFSAWADSCDRPWLFFDLGENTLIATDGRYPAGNKYGDLVDMHYMDGVPEYLNRLVADGYHVNLIVNIPASWGITGMENYIDRQYDPSTGVPAGWRDGARRFDWAQFEHIVVPTDDNFRKPQHSDLPFAYGELWLYREAMKWVPKGCQAILQTGIKEEVRAAEAVGMFARVHRPTKDKMDLLSADSFQTFISTHRTEVQQTMAAQAKAEADAAAAGVEIPRRKDPNSTE